MRTADAVMLVVILLLCWSIYRAHKDPTVRFNLLDLLMDSGRLSKTAFAFMLTLSITSWLMIRITLEGKLTEGYFTAYGAMWVAPLVAKLFSTPAPPGTTTTASSTSTSVKVDP